MDSALWLFGRAYSARCVVVKAVVCQATSARSLVERTSDSLSAMIGAAVRPSWGFATAPSAGGSGR